MSKTNAAAVEANADAIVSPVDMPDSVGRWIKRMIYGALVGVGAILPGVSGGAFCAAFGIYRPLMDFIAHPKRNFKKNILFFLPFLVGCGLGFVLLAGLVGWLLDMEGIVPLIVIALFMGCIFGTFPSILQEANIRRWKPLHYILLALSFGLSLWGLVSMEKVSDMQALISDPKSLSYMLTWIVCGAIFVLGFILPGMSPSTILICAGLYTPMTKGFWPINFSIVLPFLLGCALCLILFTKLASMLFRKAGRAMYAVIIGVVLSSTVRVIQQRICLEIFNSSDKEFIISASVGSVIAAVVGLVAVLLLARLDPRQSEDKDSGEAPSADEAAAADQQ